jgi:ribonuclease HI
MREAVLYTDGGARPTNPGFSGFACVLDIKGDDREHVISRYLGIHTNNHAEYVAVIVGIKFAAAMGVTHLTLMSDSKLIVYQIIGDYQCKNPELKPLLKDARDQIATHFPGKHMKIKWVHRSKNKRADKLCTEAINTARNGSPWRRKKLAAASHDPFPRARD